MENGPWVAGGSIRKIATNDIDIQNSDIDIFSPNKEIMQWLIAYFDKKTIFEQKIDGFYTYKYKDQYYKIQVVKHFFYKSVEELLDSFDFTATMFASDGKVVVYTQQAMIDAQLKKLVFNGEHEKCRPMRLLKYSKKGFLPVPGMIPEILGVNKPEYLEKTSLYYAGRPKDY